jgi:hypothetical protein
MTDDDSNADELRSPRRRETATRLPAEWRDVPTDPDAQALGYEAAQWERIPTTDDQQVIFLPCEEEDIEDDAFVVLEAADLCDLVTRR